MAFDVIGWMNHYHRHDLYINGESIKPVQDFALIWNLFERIVCGRFAQPKKIVEAVDFTNGTGCLDVARYSKFLAYFRNRYQPKNGGYEHIWKGLSPTDHNKNIWPLILGALQGTGSDADNVKGLLFIAYRIRNNLFHGQKEIRTLNQQAELFLNVNEMIARFIEQYDNGKNSSEAASVHS